jgi:hypothetical protein
MQQQRDIQTSDLPDSEKYELNRKLKEQINDIQKKALESMDDVYLDGIYGEVGDKRFNYGYDSENDDDRWFEIKPKKSDGDDNWYYQQEQKVTHTFGISYKDYWNNKEKYDDAFYFASGYDNEVGGDQSVIQTVKSVWGIDDYSNFATELADIKADKDDNGEAIKGTRRKKVENYIYGLDIPEIEKHILYKTQYPYINSHNYEILKYLDEREDISYNSWIKILDELDFKVDSNGYVTW